MKRLTLVGVLCLLLISAFSVWAADEALIKHADQFPLDTVVFVSARIDEETIAALDALIEEARAIIPAIPPDVNLSSALEDFVNQQMGEDIEDMQTWLGDTASIGIPLSMINSRPGEFPGYLLIDLADSSAALDFFNGKLDELDDGTSFEEVDGKQIIDSFGTTLIIAEDYMMIASTELLNQTDLRAGSLADHPLLTETLDRLPADDYGAIAFMDYGKINRANLAMMGQALPGMMDFINPIANADVAVSIGFTILDETNLVIDVAQSPYELDYAQFGMGTLVPDPVNPEFVTNVPADSFFMIHSTNLGSYLKLGLANIEAMGDYILEQGGMASFFGADMMRYMGEGERIFLNTFDLGTIAAGARYVFSGFTGMSLDDELTWMDGDLAMFIRILPNEITVGLPDMAIFIESSESGAPTDFVKNFAEALSASEIEFEQETIGDSSALVFSQLTTESGLLDPVLDILVAGSDDNFAVGQRTGVSDLMTGVDDNLADDPTYQYASKYFLPEAQQVWYLGLPALREFVDSEVTNYIRRFDSLRMMQDLEQARSMMALIDSGSITAVMSADNAFNLRMVLSLGDEPPAPLSN